MYDQVSIVVNCAGDIKLAERLRQFLLSSSVSSRVSISIENDEITLENGRSRIDNRHVRTLLTGFLGENDAFGEYSLTNMGELFTIGILRKINDLDCTNYLEKVIARRVRRSVKFLKDKRQDPDIARGHRAAIRILRAAPRHEGEIRKMIDSRKQRLQDISSIFLAQPIRHEIEALDWLLTVVRLQNEEHCRVEIV